MSNTRLYSIYKRNNNKYFFNNYHNYKFSYLDKKKKKNHIMLNFLVRCTDYRLVHY